MTSDFELSLSKTKATDLSEGAGEFFKWLDSELCNCEIFYQPACGQIEIKLSVLGEGEYYWKKAPSFATFHQNALEHYKRPPYNKPTSNTHEVTGDI